MGAIIARFQKKKTTFEKLEKLDQDIKSIEKFRYNTQQAQKKIVGHFILISAGIYILVAVTFYFYFFPATFHDQLFYITPLLLVPFIIWFVKKLLTFYYKKKISRNESKLSGLQTEKKKLLDQVMDTETYKVAKTILEKFAPDQLRKSPGPYDVTPYKSTISSSTIMGQTPASSMIRSRALLGSTRTPVVVPVKTPAIRGTTQALLMNTPINVTNGQNTIAPSALVRQAATSPLPMPRAILPRERSMLDKMVEYLVGDGPGNRYALICRSCQSHNGMALREEFEYVAFRCCYCYTYNPARKLRPSAPILQQERSPIRRQISSEKSSSESEKISDTDSESEKELKTQENSEIESVPMDVDQSNSDKKEN